MDTLETLPKTDAAAWRRSGFRAWLTWDLCALGPREVGRVARSLATVPTIMQQLGNYWKSPLTKVYSKVIEALGEI
eukprot:5466614-Amphidinium_carterae.1